LNVRVWVKSGQNTMELYLLFVGQGLPRGARILKKREREREKERSRERGGKRERGGQSPLPPFRFFSQCAIYLLFDGQTFLRGVGISREREHAGERRQPTLPSSRFFSQYVIPIV